MGDQAWSGGIPSALPTGTVTFVFTDVVGSTRLWEQAPDAMGRAMVRHDELIEGAVARYDGVVVRPRGEGDSRFVVFTRASAAVAAGLDVVRALSSEPWDTPEPVRVRLAVHTGEADLRDGDYYGTAVNRCARLRGLGHPHQVLVSQATAELVRSSLPPGASLEELGEHALRDLSRPERVFQLCHRDLPDEFPALDSAMSDGEVDRVALPVVMQARAKQDEAEVFVGRDAEVAALMQRLEKLPEGPAELVVLSGEAGIGKTRLCAEFAREAHAGGATVLYGRTDEDLGLPYQPWVEALSHLVRANPAVVTRRDAAELARLVPVARELVPAAAVASTSDPETERYLLFGAVATMLSRASRDAPVVVVVDDLHWADKPTLSLLRSLVTSPVPLRVLVVGTYRDSEVSRGHPLADALTALWREPNVERLTLSGLDASGLFALLEREAGYELSDDVVGLAEALRRDTGGNPFFAREILRHLVETGAIRRGEDGRWQADVNLSDARLPASVREVVGQRVARLGDDAQRALSAASVVGRDFDLELLAALTDLSEDALLDVLEEAMAAAVIEEVPGRGERFTFAHALIQRTLYEDIGATRRGRLHRRVAEALEDVCDADGGDRVGELAYHWAAATAPVQATKAVDYARLAGERALGALAPDEAIRWFTQALELAGNEPDSDALRCDLRIALGVAQRQAGLAEHRQTLLDAAAEALRLRDTGRLVRAALANNRGSEASAGEIDDERVAVVRAALEALGSVRTADRARLLANLALELTYEPDPTNRRALADDAVALARQLDDPATLLHSLNAQASSLRLPETLGERLASTNEARQLAQGLNDPEREFSAHRQRLQAALESEDRSELDRAVQAMHEIATRVGQPRLVWSDLQNRAVAALLAGEIDQSEQFANDAFDIGTRSGQPDALTTYGVQLLDVRTHQGRTDEIVDTLLAAVPDVPGLPALRAAVAHGFIDARRFDDAARLLDSSTLEHPRDENWLIGTSLWGFVVARLGRPEHAPWLYEQLVPWAGQHPTAVVATSESIHHCLGELAALLDRGEQADQHFAAAEAGARRLQAPFFVARTLIERGRLDLTRGEPDRARGYFDEALDLARQYGYSTLERDASQLGG